MKLSTTGFPLLARENIYTLSAKRQFEDAIYQDDEHELRSEFQRFANDLKKALPDPDQALEHRPVSLLREICKARIDILTKLDAECDSHATNELDEAKARLDDMQRDLEDSRESIERLARVNMMEKSPFCKRFWPRYTRTVKEGAASVRRRSRGHGGCAGRSRSSSAERLRLASRERPEDRSGARGSAAAGLGAAPGVRPRSAGRGTDAPFELEGASRRYDWIRLRWSATPTERTTPCGRSRMKLTRSHTTSRHADVNGSSGKQKPTG